MCVRRCAVGGGLGEEGGGEDVCVRDVQEISVWVVWNCSVQYIIN